MDKYLTIVLLILISISIPFLLVKCTYKILNYFFFLVESVDVPEYKNKCIFGKVIRVIDGDTIKFSHRVIFRRSGKPITVRIIGVDAPEIQFRSKVGQLFGKEAKEFVESRLLNRSVRLKVLGKDIYNRMLGNVFINNESISLILVKYGLAMVYKTRVEFDGMKEELLEAERVAKSRNIGIWSVNLTEPSKFRKERNN